MANNFLKTITFIIFFIIFCNFTILNYNPDTINEIVYLILLCAILYIFHKEKSYSNQFEILKPILRNSSIFYVITNAKHDIIYIDDRHSAINNIVELENKEDLLSNILMQFGINEIFIENIISNIRTNFEINLKCESNNLNINFLADICVKNISLKNYLQKFKDRNLYLLQISQFKDNNIMELCDNYKFTYIRLNNKFNVVQTNKTFNSINQYIDTSEIAKIISNNTKVENKLSANKQNIFLYEKDNAKFNIFTFFNTSWNSLLNNFEYDITCIISKESTNMTTDYNYCWETYCANNQLPIAQINNNFEIVKSNSSFNSLVNKKTHINSISEYIKFHNYTDKNTIMSNNNIIIQCTLISGNMQISLYCHKINSLDGMIIYIVSQNIDKKENTTIYHEQKIQMIGQLVSGIAHDFNNLLTAMLGFSDLLLLKHPTGDPSFPEIIQIKQNIIRAINLVRNLLAFSRKQVFEIKIINVNDIIFNISDLLKRLIKEDIVFKTHYDQKIQLIEIDQGQLEQALINLIINSRDAIKSNGQIDIYTYQKHIKISSDIDSDNDMIFQCPDIDEIKSGNYVVIKIQDNGSGIDKNSISKIFEPFYSTKKINNGTGLGLSMVYGIIKQSNGYIYFTTNNTISNHGTIFYLLFPITKKEKMQINKLHMEKAPDLTSNDKILIVEDDNSVRLFISEALKIKGYDVISAKSGEDALEILKEIQVDLLITDIIMPGIDGYQLAEQITKLNIIQPKILFISGHNRNQNKTLIKKYNFLNKPFSIKELTMKLKDVR